MKLSKKALTLVMLSSFVVSSFIHIAYAQTGDFGFDIPKNYKNKEAIQYLHDKGVIQGYPDGTFKPDQTVNRAELLKILLEGNGLSPDEELYKNCFPDVKDEWFAKYVCYAKEQEYVKGYPDGTFKPEQTVNKVEAVKMLVETQEDLKKELPEAVPEEIYDDTNRKEWYAPYIYVAKQKGLLEETGTTFEPAQGMRRSGISENIFRSMKIREEKKMRYDKAQYQELYEEPNYEILQAQGVPLVVTLLSPPRQYAKGSQDVPLLTFRIKANTDILIDTLVIGMDAMPNLSFPEKGGLIDTSSEKPKGNFTDFKITHKDTNAVMLGPVELSTKEADGKGDLYQMITFTGGWGIKKGVESDIALTADIADNINIVNTHFFASLPNLNVASRIYDESGNRLTNIVPNKDLKGGLVTVRHDVGLTVSLSSSQPTSFIVPNYAAHQTFLNLDFTAGPEDDVVIRGLRMSFKDTGGFNEFSELYLYEGEVRLTDAGVIDYENNNVYFPSLETASSLVVMPGETRTLSVRGGIGKNPDSSSFQFILSSQGDIRASAPEITGNFPLVGNSQSIEGTISEALSISKYDVTLAPQFSRTDQKVAAFYLTPLGSELTLKKIALQLEGEVPLDQITNFVLTGADSLKLASSMSTVNAIGEDFVVFEFLTPFTLKTGGQAYPFEIYATIGSNVKTGYSLSFFLNDPADIEIFNENGYGIAAIENNYDNRKWHSDYSSWSRISEPTSVPQIDEVTLSYNSNNPSYQVVVPGQQDVNFLIFDIVNTGVGDVDVTGFTFYLAGSGSMKYLKNIFFERYDMPGRYIIQARTVDEEKRTIQFEDFRIYLKSGDKASVRVYADIDEAAQDGIEYSLELSNVEANGAGVRGVPLKGEFVGIDVEAPEPSELQLSLSSNNPKDKKVHGGQQNEPLIIFDAWNTGPRDIVITELAFYRDGSGTSSFDDFTDFSIEVTSRSLEVSGKMIEDSNGQDSVKFENLSISLNPNDKLLIYFWGDISEKAQVGNTHTFELYDVNAYSSNEGTISDVTSIGLPLFGNQITIETAPTEDPTEGYVLEASLNSKNPPDQTVESGTKFTFMTFDLVHTKGDTPITINTMSFNFTGTGSIVNDLSSIYFYTSENGSPIDGHSSEETAIPGVGFSEFKIELDPGERISVTVGAYLKTDAKKGVTHSLSLYDVNAFIINPDGTADFLDMKANTVGFPLQSSIMTVTAAEVF